MNNQVQYDRWRSAATEEEATDAEMSPQERYEQQQEEMYSKGMAAWDIYCEEELQRFRIDSTYDVYGGEGHSKDRCD